MHPLASRPFDLLQEPLQPLGDLLGRERAGPARVRRGQHEAPRDLGPAPVELERERRAPREPQDMRPVEPEGFDQAGQAVGVVDHPERLGRIRRRTTSRRVPREEGEPVGQAVELPSPLAVVAHPAVEEHERWTVSSALVRDRQPADVDPVHPPDHVRSPAPGNRSRYSRYPNSRFRFFPVIS